MAEIFGAKNTCSLIVLKLNIFMKEFVVLALLIVLCGSSFFDSDPNVEELTSKNFDSKVKSGKYVSIVVSFQLRLVYELF